MGHTMSAPDKDPHSKKREHDAVSLEPNPHDCPEGKRRLPRLPRRRIPPEVPPELRCSRESLEELDRRTQGVGRGAFMLQSGIKASFGPELSTVQQFAKHGGPDLTYFCGFAQLAGQVDMNQSSQSHSFNDRKCPSSSSASDAAGSAEPCDDANFDRNLIDNGVNPEGCKSDNTSTPAEPTNLEDLQAALRAVRISLSPSQFTNDDFRQFRKRVQAHNDEAARADVLSFITGESTEQYCHASNQVFDHLTSLCYDLPRAKPRLYDGAPLHQIDSRVQHALGRVIVPCESTSLPAVPNFFLEENAVESGPDVAQELARHDGAIGARAMHNLLNYDAAEEFFDGKASSYSATYDHGTGALQLYAHHITAPKAPDDNPVCHTTKLYGSLIVYERRHFVEGVGAFRNLRALAKASRDRFIYHANQMAFLPPAEAPSTTPTDSQK